MIPSTFVTDILGSTVCMEIQCTGRCLIIVLLVKYCYLNYFSFRVLLCLFLLGFHCTDNHFMRTSLKAFTAFVWVSPTFAMMSSNIPLIIYLLDSIYLLPLSTNTKSFGTVSVSNILSSSNPADFTPEPSVLVLNTNPSIGSTIASSTIFVKPSGGVAPVEIALPVVPKRYTLWSGSICPIRYIF